MILDLIPESARAAGLGALMKGAGKVTRYIPIPNPTLLVGPGASSRLGEAIAAFGHAKLMIVTDPVVEKLGLLNGVIQALKAAGTPYAVFAEITPDAPIPLIERGLRFLDENDCDALLAFGGGSAMDAAKAIALAAANPKPIRKLAGYLKGLSTPLPLYAVPTTAGTGSEVTVAAVISDPVKLDKVVIVDPRLVPRMAALDPELMTGLPPAVTAATGIDALTHAVESFVGKWATPQTEGLSLAAVGMIFANLGKAYRDGKNLKAREQMALAASYAGMAFTRANVGYVHAIAHQLGGRYHVPHGLANAMLLPSVMRFSAPAIVPQLARLAVAAKLGDASERDEQLADRFLDALEALNRELGIPTVCEALQAKDIPLLAKAACLEAETGYPVPRYMSQKQCEALLRALLPPLALAAPPAKKAAVKKAAARKAPAKKSPAKKKSA